MYLCIILSSIYNKFTVKFLLDKKQTENSIHMLQHLNILPGGVLPKAISLHISLVYHFYICLANIKAVRRGLQDILGWENGQLPKTSYYSNKQP